MLLNPHGFEEGGNMTREREFCKLCPDDINGFANINAHIRHKHGMSREDYDAIQEEAFNDVLEDVVPYKTKEEFLEQPMAEQLKETKKDSITREELYKHMFDNVERKHPDRPLSDFCKEWEISEGELINLVKKYKGEAEIPPLERIKNEEELGEKKAEKIAKALPKTVRTIDPFEAQNLREKYGYQQKEVISAKGLNPKTYVLTLAEDRI